MEGAKPSRRTTIETQIPKLRSKPVRKMAAEASSQGHVAEKRPHEDDEALQQEQSPSAPGGASASAAGVPPKGEEQQQQPLTKKQRKALMKEKDNSNRVIAMAAKFNDSRAAMEEFRAAKASSGGNDINPNSYNTLMHLCTGGENWDRVARGEIVPPAAPHHYVGIVAVEWNFREPLSLEELLEASTELEAELERKGVKNNEIIFTCRCRLAMLRGDPEASLAMALKAQAEGMTRLRTFTPPLLGFCLQGNMDGAFRCYIGALTIPTLRQLTILILSNVLGMLQCAGCRDIMTPTSREALDSALDALLSHPHCCCITHSRVKEAAEAAGLELTESEYLLLLEGSRTAGCFSSAFRTIKDMKSELVMLQDDTISMLQSIFESDAAAAALADGGVLAGAEPSSGARRWEVVADTQVRRWRRRNERRIHDMMAACHGDGDGDDDDEDDNDEDMTMVVVMKMKMMMRMRMRPQ